MPVRTLHSSNTQINLIFGHRPETEIGGLTTGRGIKLLFEVLWLQGKSLEKMDNN